MHAKGYAYEVRFQGSWFDFQQTPVRGGFRIIRGRVIRDFPKRDKLVADLRRMFSNKIVSSHTRYLPDLRIYLRSEAELVQLRMITNAEVFRVYRLLPPAEADGSISKNDAIVSESQA
ncbi:MAG: hypothetical protein EOP83_06245 [Verrucomicrobiaceae bacterium]|nr:MAG: hypothetical protein EOP83_06245 [Verrucomicrobiaceae bacterium]